MIVIKTRMRSIPTACVHCRYYVSRNLSDYDMPGCKAVSGYPEGKALQMRYAYTPVTTARPKWCPLREVDA